MAIDEYRLLIAAWRLPYGDRSLLTADFQMHKRRNIPRQFF